MLQYFALIQHDKSTPPNKREEFEAKFLDLLYTLITTVTSLVRPCFHAQEPEQEEHDRKLQYIRTVIHIHRDLNTCASSKELYLDFSNSYYKLDKPLSSLFMTIFSLTEISTDTVQLH